MNKQEVIKQAFGKSWNKLSFSMQDHILNRHHWVDRSSNRMNLSPSDLGFKNEDCEIRHEFWRPISLKGIETNNGWIKIESSGDLPKEGEFRVWPFGRIENNIFSARGVKMCYEAGRISHYQPVKEILHPIY